MRFRRKERGTRVKDRAKNGVSKRAGWGWGRKEGNQKRNPRTRISALFRKRTYKQSLFSSVVQATLGWTQEGHARRSEGERKTKNYLEKDCRERAKQSRVEELGSSQSGCTRQKVLVRQRGGLKKRLDMMMMMMMMMIRCAGTHGKGQRKNSVCAVVCTRVEKLAWQAISTRSSSAHVEERYKDQEPSQTHKYWGREWLLLQF